MASFYPSLNLMMEIYSYLQLICVIIQQSAIMRIISSLLLFVLIIQNSLAAHNNSKSESPISCSDITALASPAIDVEGGTIEGTLGKIENLLTKQTCIFLKYNSIPEASGPGCMDQMACNFNPLATIDDGTCSYISGCTEPEACNYNPAAGCDDGSCSYVNAVFELSVGQANGFVDLNATVFGASDDPAFPAECDMYTLTYPDNSIRMINPDDYGLGDGIINSGFIANYPGLYNLSYTACCQLYDGTISTSTYNENFTVFPCDEFNLASDWLSIQMFTFPGGALDFSIYDNSNATVVASGTADFEEISIFEEGLCLPPGCYTLIIELNGYMPFNLYSGDWYFTNEGLAGQLMYNIPFTIGGVLGCMDTYACNYNPSATCMDASQCAYLSGCTDPAACNFDPSAICDDGSCSFCPAETWCLHIDISQIGGDMGGGSVYIQKYDLENTIVASAQINAGGTQGTLDTCIPAEPGCYQLIVVNNNNGGIFRINEITGINGEIEFHNLEYPIMGEYGLMTWMYDNPNPELWIGSCMDPSALNYDPTAVCHDPIFCQYCDLDDRLYLTINDANPGTYDGTSLWIYAPDGSNVSGIVNINGLYPPTEVFCNNDQCGLWYVEVVPGERAADVSWSITNSNGEILAYGGAVDLINVDNNFGLNAHFVFNPKAAECGCTDNYACNYNPNAIISTPETCEYCVEGYNCAQLQITLMPGEEIDAYFFPEIQVFSSTQELNFTLGWLSPGVNYFGFCIDEMNGCYTAIANTPELSPFNYSWSYIVDGVILASGVQGDTITFSVGNIIYGCTEANACNYNQIANCDDGSCHYEFGCTDPAAYNFNSEAICDDGSCSYCLNDQMILNMSDTGNDGWEGSQLMIFNSYDELVGTYTLNSGSDSTMNICLPFDCEQYKAILLGGSDPSECSWLLTHITGFWYSGMANELISFYANEHIVGCTNPYACNYDPNANCSGCNSCQFCNQNENCLSVTVESTFEGDINYNQGMIIHFDEDYFNNPDYNSYFETIYFERNTSTEPVNYSICLPYGCYSYEFINLDPEETFTWTLNGVNETLSGQSNDSGTFSTGLIINGCTDATAYNFNPLATCDDGSCLCCPAQMTCLQLDWNYDQYSYPDGGIIKILNSDGYIIKEIELNNGYLPYNTENICLSDGCYKIEVLKDPGLMSSLTVNIAGSNEEFLTVSDSDELVFTVGFTLDECSDPEAINYNPNAICTSIENCIYIPLDTCPQDVNNDGLVNTGDLLALLAAFGSVCP